MAAQHHIRCFRPWLAGWPKAGQARKGGGTTWPPFDPAQDHPPFWNLMRQGPLVALKRRARLASGRMYQGKDEGLRERGWNLGSGWRLERAMGEHKTAIPSKHWGNPEVPAGTSTQRKAKGRHFNPKSNPREPAPGTYTVKQSIICCFISLSRKDPGACF